MDRAPIKFFSEVVELKQSTTERSSPVIEILTSSSRDEILQHLLELGTFDRKLRFCGALPDRAIVEYVGRVDFTRDLVLGYRERGKLVALVHLGAMRTTGDTELGISVADVCRGKGLGVRLTRAAFRLAHERGFSRVHVYYLDENLPMQAIVRHYPVPVHREGGDNEVCIPLELAA